MSTGPAPRIQKAVVDKYKTLTDQQKCEESSYMWEPSTNDRAEWFGPTHKFQGLSPFNTFFVTGEGHSNTYLQDLHSSLVHLSFAYTPLVILFYFFVWFTVLFPLSWSQKLNVNSHAMARTRNASRNRHGKTQSPPPRPYSPLRKADPNAVPAADRYFKNENGVLKVCIAVVLL
jgi:hypothetical protein